MSTTRLSEAERRRRIAHCAQVVALCNDPAFPSDEDRALARSELAEAWAQDMRSPTARDLFEEVA